MYRVLHSDANGVPLGAEANERYFKVVFIDVGMLCRGCGLTMEDIQTSEELMIINSGAVSEQFVAQHLLYSGKYYEEPQLFCGFVKPEAPALRSIIYLHKVHILYQ